MKTQINLLLICFLLLVTLLSEAQNKKYAVFFNQKRNGNTFSLNAPQAFLSERSVQRRIAQGLPLDSTDLPVIPAYLNEIRNTGASVLYQMRWLNGAIIDCNEAQFQSVQNLPFVLNVNPLNAKIPGSPVRKTVQSGAQSIDYGPSAGQNAQLELDSMHAWGFHGEGKLIAVMDAGFLNVHTHPAFAHLFQNQKLKGTRDLVARDGDVFSDNWHGGAVLSNIAAYQPGSIVGGAYAAEYYLIRSEDVASEHEIECAYWVVGLELADSIGADLINSSLGYTTFDIPSMNYNYNTLNGQTSIASRAASMAASKGMVVVNSAGNEGNSSSWGGWISVPADAKNILAVGAIDNAGTVVGFSGKGPTPDGRVKPDLVAQGSGTVIADVNSGSGITYSSGTSFSAPVLSGLVAGFWQSNPNLTAMQVMNLLRSSGTNQNSPDNIRGWGTPGFIRAYLLSGAKPTLSIPYEIRVFPNPVKGSAISLNLLPGQQHESLNFQLLDSKGRIIREGAIGMGENESQFLIPVNGCKPGIYHLKIAGKNGLVSKKIILN